MKLRRYFPSAPQIFPCVRELYPNIERSQQALDSSTPREIWANQYLRFFGNKWKIHLRPY